MPVTHEEGDRYPLGPPKLNADVAHQVEQQTENLCVAGSSPAVGTKELMPR